MENFPVGIHLIFIPVSIAVGFVLGWIIRGAAEGPRRRPGGGAGDPGRTR
jgi:hypothetical protein